MNFAGYLFGEFTFLLIFIMVDNFALLLPKNSYKCGYYLTFSDTQRIEL